MVHAHGPSLPWVVAILLAALVAVLLHLGTRQKLLDSVGADHPVDEHQQAHGEHHQGHGQHVEEGEGREGHVGGQRCASEGGISAETLESREEHSDA